MSGFMCLDDWIIGENSICLSSPVELQSRVSQLGCRFISNIEIVQIRIHKLKKTFERCLPNPGQFLRAQCREFGGRPHSELDHGLAVARCGPPPEVQLGRGQLKGVRLPRNITPVGMTAATAVSDGVPPDRQDLVSL